MRIAMIGQKGIPATFGGVEKHVQDLSLELVRRGHSVTVYSRAWYAPETTSTFQNITVVNRPSIRTKHLDTISHTLLATVHAIRAGHDIIHYHGVGPALLSFIPRYFAPKITVIATFHSIDRKHKKWGVIARTILRIGEWATCTFPHHTIAVSRTIAQYARDVYDRDTIYIPNSVAMPPSAVSDKPLDSWGLAPEEYILVVSRLIPHKGIHYVMEAFRELEQESPEIIGNKKLVVVGDGYYTGDYVRSLTEIAMSSDNIIMTGFQSGDALAALFGHAALMVHPSDNEGMPLTVLEGMSYGLPILLSDIPEHHDLVADRRSFFRHGNVKSLKAQLTTLLAMNEAERAMIGQENRDTVMRHYTWDATMETLLSVYEHAGHKETTPIVRVA
jgi:glycosyltransferase involved in cell wall biosynthesis